MDAIERKPSRKIFNLYPSTEVMTDLKLGKYQHYKGKFYKVIGVARHSETLEELVVPDVQQNFFFQKTSLNSARC